MVATETGGGVGGSEGSEVAPMGAAIFLSAPPNLNPKQVITQLILSQQEEIWQLSEFYMKPLPPLTSPPPGSLHPSDG